MQRMLLTVGLLLGVSGLFVGVHTASADEHIRTYEAGTAIEPLTLPGVPEGSGTPPFTYTLTPDLPAGLMFDPDTRTISGTPLAASPATEYTYTVTDGANASLPRYRSPLRSRQRMSQSPAV